MGHQVNEFRKAHEDVEDWIVNVCIRILRTHFDLNFKYTRKRNLYLSRT